MDTQLLTPPPPVPTLKLNLTKNVSPPGTERNKDVVMFSYAYSTDLLKGDSDPIIHSTNVDKFENNLCGDMISVGVSPTK